MVHMVEQSIIGSHIEKAHKTIRGEHQLAEYVTRMSLDECVQVLTASEIRLSSLAANHPQCRVGQREDRSFEDVIRVWTLYVLSGAEGG